MYMETWKEMVPKKEIVVDHLYTGQEKCIVKT